MALIVIDERSSTSASAALLLQVHDELSLDSLEGCSEQTSAQTLDEIGQWWRIATQPMPWTTTAPFKAARYFSTQRALKR